MVENLKKKFDAVIQAFGCPYSENEKDYTSAKNEMKNIEKLFESLKGVCNKEDKLFIQKYSKFLNKYKERIKVCDEKLKKTMESYHNLADYFCVNKKEESYNKPELFFKLFGEFFVKFDKAMPKESESFVRKYNIGEKFKG